MTEQGRDRATHPLTPSLSGRGEKADPSASRGRGERTIAPGLRAEKEWTLRPEMLYSPSGLEQDAVLSSPSMIMMMESTAAEAIRSQLAPGTATVGFHVDVKHIAPAPPGAQIVTSAELVESDGRKLTFAVEARHGDRLIGTGRHRRAIIHVQRSGEP